jgi:heme oxygenase
MTLHRLRDETRPNHQALEAHIDLLQRVWSLPLYSQFLQKFYGFYGVLEPRIFARDEWREYHFDVERRRKVPLLQVDLQFLGLDETQIEALPRPQHVPQPANFAEVLGCAYVLEGATLGGQVIVRHFGRELELSPQHGCHFFASYGTEVGKRWQEFLQLLNYYEATPEQEDALIHSASATFASLHRWLSDLWEPPVPLDHDR